MGGREEAPKAEGDRMILRERKLTAGQAERVSGMVDRLVDARWVAKKAKEDSAKAARSIIKAIGLGSVVLVSGRRVSAVAVWVPAHEVGDFGYDTVVVKKVKAGGSKE